MKGYISVFFVLILTMSFNFLYSLDMNPVENRIIKYDFNSVFTASIELLIKHSWQFRIIDKDSGFIQTRPYNFRFKEKSYAIYVRIIILSVNENETKVHISWQAGDIYRNALGLPLEIGRKRLTVEEKINQYFEDLLYILQPENEK